MDYRLFFPATERNRGPIGSALSKVLPESGTILEIASGSGEHGVTFQKRFPNIVWQTSDPVHSYRKSISAWINYHNLSKKMPEPIDLDVEKRPWPLSIELRSTLKSIVCINMLHISAWSCTKALFEEADSLLKSDHLLLIYGPFKLNGHHISESNLRFDKSLKDTNSVWGVRDLEAVSKIAINNGFDEIDTIKMPANNFLLNYKKK